MRRRLARWLFFFIAVLAQSGELFAQPCSLDEGFSTELNSGAAVYTLALQTNGQILIGGSFYFIGEALVPNFARLNPDGSLDGTFNPGSAADMGYVNAMAIQDDGKILVGGSFSSSSGTSPPNVTRLNTDGTVDWTFNLVLRVDGPVNAIVVLPNGSILIGGGFRFVEGVLRRSIARLFPDGTLDASFDACVADTAGAGATGLAVASNGKIFASGTFSFSTGFTRSGIARLNPNGDIDTTYAAAQPGINSGTTAYALALRSNGTAVLGGNFTAYRISDRGGIVQLTTSGTVDDAFDPGTGIGSDSTIYTLSQQHDGKIMIGGNFIRYNDQTRYGVARVNVDGSLDTACDSGAGPDNAVSSFAIQPDGRILVAGRFSNYNDRPKAALARLKGDPRLGIPSGMGSGQSQLTFYSGDPVPSVLQASSNLVDWVTITNFTPDSSAVPLIDPTSASASRRFYRVKSPP